MEKVTEPTEWVNSFVIVEKVIDSSNAHSPNHVIKKSIRLCIDPKDVNEALEREPYYSRTIDELISMFAGAKVFTIVDMDKGYWQVVLHPESRKLTCMAFDIGRYQFKRLPMGSKVASDIFQRMLDSVYIGLPGVTGIADDRISKQRELIAKKEGKFYTNTKDFQDGIKALPFEAGQNVWLQNSDSRKCEEVVIREKSREPNSYMVEIPATGQCFRRNSNFIKPRQSNQNSVSTDPQPTTGLPEIPQESQYSNSQQFQVAKLPVQWMPFPQYPLRCRMEILLLELLDNPGYPGEAPKEFHPQDLDCRSDIPCTDILISEREMLRYESE